MERTGCHQTSRNVRDRTVIGQEALDRQARDRNAPECKNRTEKERQESRGRRAQESRGTDRQEGIGSKWIGLFRIAKERQDWKG